MDERKTAGDEVLRHLDHDLRNPVANILGFVDLVREAPDGALTADQLTCLARIEDNCRDLLALIDRLSAQRGES